jgi:NAD(P)-dependent dehydrogenase (short-subunit alcohol dehydrogenase family)
VSTQSSERVGAGRLAGRSILVIGGGQQRYGIEDGPVGIGRAISVLCGREGAAVAVSDVDRRAADETVAEAGHAGAPKAAAFYGDAADEADVARIMAATIERLGGLDGLVMSVGVPRGFRVDGTSSQDWDEAFAINVRSHFLGCKHALPVLPAGSSIVLISSIAALAPVNEIPAYHASKAALGGLCRYIAHEGAPRRIRANIVVPGLIDTTLGRLATKFDPSRAQKPIPLGRQGTAWEVAHAVTFLLSAEASYITAQSLVVDGGYIDLR